jgi:formylmethanofuran dehydrogenase subunit E
VGTRKDSTEVRCRVCGWPVWEELKNIVDGGYICRNYIACIKRAADKKDNE